MKKLLTLTLFLFVTLCYVDAQASIAGSPNGNVYENAFPRRVVVDGIYYLLWPNEASVDSCVAEVTKQHEISIPPYIEIKGKRYMVTRIDELALYNCNDSANIKLPNTIKDIARNSFYSDKQKSIILPESLMYIDPDIFNNLGNLERIEVNKSNNSFFTEDGVLYNKDKTMLIAYPQAKQDSAFTIPMGVKVIGDNAFDNNKYLKYINLPNSLIHIGQKAFANAKSLEHIYFSSGLKTIGESAFDNVNIKSIIFPNSVCWIGSGDLGSKQLEELKLPDSLKVLLIGISAKKIILPPGLERIGIGGSFFTKRVYFPKTLKDIDSYEVIYPGKEDTLVFDSPKPPMLYIMTDGGLRHFLYEMNHKCTLIVPKESVDLYKKTYPYSISENIISK